MMGRKNYIVIVSRVLMVNKPPRNRKKQFITEVIIYGIAILLVFVICLPAGIFCALIDAGIVFSVLVIRSFILLKRK